MYQAHNRFITKLPTAVAIGQTVRKAMTFNEYLSDKKIDSRRFQQTEPAQFDEWQQLFEQLHPDSFTAQKKFLLNNTRRKYLLR